MRCAYLEVREADGTVEHFGSKPLANARDDWAWVVEELMGTENGALVVQDEQSPTEEGEVMCKALYRTPSGNVEMLLINDGSY